MIYGMIHFKGFKLDCVTCKIKGLRLSEDEKRYIKACVKDILQYCEKDKMCTKEEFIAKNLPDYGVKIISYSTRPSEFESFLADFLKQ